MPNATQKLDLQKKMIVTKPNLTTIAIAAKTASRKMAIATSEQKNKALTEIIRKLKEKRDVIIRANREDVFFARSAGLGEEFIEKISIYDQFDAILADIEDLIALPDPIGEIFDQKLLDNGLTVVKRRTAIGVLGIIYELRPHLTIEAAVLTIKSGNCAILRGGSETISTNMAFEKIIQESLASVQLPLDAIQLLSSTARSDVEKLLKMNDYIDLIIPCGGKILHQFCKDNSTIPVISGGMGICHLFIDESADLQNALSLIVNAKTQYVGECNALDTLVVHHKVASDFIPKIIETLGAKGVSFRLDPASWELVSYHDERRCQLAQIEDWDTEWLGLILGIRVAHNLKEAMQFVIQHSTGHSDGIVTQNVDHAEAFIREVDSATVYVNAPISISNGGQLGLGTKIAISTQKFHARGPVGLQELTSYKWVIKGLFNNKLDDSVKV